MYFMKIQIKQDLYTSEVHGPVGERNISIKNVI